MFIALLTLSFVLAQQTAQNAAQSSSHVPLLIDGEKVVISFVMQDSDKVLTVATSNDGRYIVYRFGQENAVELEYPTNLKSTDSWEKFEHSYYVRDVGDDGLALEMRYLEFSNYGYTYRVYDAYSEEFSKSFVGVIVIEHSTGIEYDIQAVASSKLGGLEQLDGLAMIEARSLMTRNR